MHSQARQVVRAAAALGFLLAFAAVTCCAQELSPRAYWPAPTGTQVLVLGYVFSSGDVVTDPTLPLTGVDSSLHKAVLGYFHTTSILGRTTNFVFELPYAWGNTTGLLNGAPQRRDLSDLGDLSMTLSVNLIGAPAMSLEEFRELSAKPRPILGASVRVIAPTGAYEEDRLINVGTNRWALKAELGYILPLTPDWLFELELGAWLFGDNDEFLGTTREQDPIYATELHLVRRFGGGRWASLEANYYFGGRTTVGGVYNDDLQRNSTLGGSFVWPVGTRQSLRLGLSTGVVTNSGGNYQTVLLSYIRVFR